MIRNKLQIGVVGGGMIADAHMGNFVKDGRTQLRWLAETNTERLNEKAKKYSVPNATTDYREMLKDEELDAVVVCTPPWLHVKMGVDVMKAGKHLLMEKPLATTVADALTLLAEARRHPHLKVSGCSCRHSRLNPKFHFVKKMIFRSTWACSANRASSRPRRSAETVWIWSRPEPRCSPWKSTVPRG